ncbi:MAG: response regulator [Anaerolineae bacterium]|nr:response regulator [Anaerolineae bacterium]
MSERDLQDIIILMVEDTPEFAQLTRLTLKRIGLSVVHAPTGEEAVAYLQQQQPHLLLLDLNLPGMSGWQVLEHMVALYGAGSVPVIVTSAYSDGANRVIGKLQNVYKYLIKPFQPRELLLTVQQALNLPPQEV